MQIPPCAEKVYGPLCQIEAMKHLQDVGCYFVVNEFIFMYVRGSAVLSSELV